jgi:hypothetical protein
VVNEWMRPGMGFQGAQRGELEFAFHHVHISARRSVFWSFHRTHA